MVVLESGLGFWAGSLSSAIRKGLIETLEPFGIDPVQWAILDVCFRGKADTVTGISRVVPVDVPVISRHVDNLSRRNLIRRRRMQTDRRVVKLSLTPQGRSLMSELAKHVEANNDRFFKHITKEEQRTVITAIHKMLAGAAKEE